MARVQLKLPEKFLFATEIQVRVTDINYGGHLGNDTILSFLSEARMRFLAHYGLKELDMFGGGLVVADASIVYKTEAFHGETLKIEVTVADFNKYGCDFFYRVTEKTSGREVARAKTGNVFFDFQQRRLQLLPEPLHALFADGSAPI